MKSLLATLSAAVAICALLTSSISADTGVETRPNGKTKSSNYLLKRRLLKKGGIVIPDALKKPADTRANDKILDKDIIVDPKTRNSDNSRIKDVKVAHGVRIAKFTAKRETEINRIVITAVLTNFAKETDENVGFSISHKVRGRWVNVAEGRVTVKARDTLPIPAEMELTNDEVLLKLDITTETPLAHATKPFRLKAVQIVSQVLRYGTTDWVLAYERRGEVDTNKLRANAAKKRATQLNEFGFQTRIIAKTNQNVFTDTEVVQLWIRTTEDQSQTFRTVEEAQEFARTMKSLIKDGVSVWSRVEPE